MRGCRRRLRFGGYHSCREEDGEEIAGGDQGQRVNILLEKVGFVSPSISVK